MIVFFSILYGDIGFIEPLIDFRGMLFYMNSYYLCFQVLFSLNQVLLSVWVVFQVWFRTWAFESVLIFSKYEVGESGRDKTACYHIKD